MQLKNRKRFLALVAAAAMALAPCAAFAANSSTGNVTSDVKPEGWVGEGVYNVTLPTVSAGAFDLILDPQDLLSSTQNSADNRYGSSATFTGGTGAYFMTAANTYKNETTDIVIKSASSNDVNVSVKATVAVSGTSISFTTDSAFTGDTSTSVYLALVETTGTTPATVTVANDPESATGASATLSNTIPKLASSNFKYSWDSSANEWKMIADGTPTANEYKFKLSAAVNKNADWGKATDFTAKLDLVWDVQEDTGMQTATNGGTIVWDDTTQPLTFNLDLASFGGTTLNDIGVNISGTVYGYNATGTGKAYWGDILKQNEFITVSADGKQITINPTNKNGKSVADTFAPMVDSSMFLRVDDKAAGVSGSFKLEMH